MARRPEKDLRAIFVAWDGKQALSMGVGAYIVNSSELRLDWPDGKLGSAPTARSAALASCLDRPTVPPLAR